MVDIHQHAGTIHSMSKIFEQLRKAIERSPKTCSELAREAGLEKAAMSRFVNRITGLSVESAEALARVLGLELTLRRKAHKGR